MTLNSKSPIILIDGNNFLYRAYYSVSRANLTNSKGEPTGAIKVYISMLTLLAKDYPNSSLAVVFDAHGKCFRHDLYPEYKATRKPMPSELVPQMAIIKEIIKAKGIKIISVLGVEADDVLGSYAKCADESGMPLLIASGDKDLAALVTDNVQIVDTMAKKVFDRVAVIEKYGVPPELISDFLALKGDTADNIPGMSGIGDKTACALLNQIGNIEAIKKNLDKVKDLSFRGSKNFADKFLEQEVQINLSRKLTEIKRDVKLTYTLPEIQSTSIVDHYKLLEIYKRCEFSNLIKEEELFINLNKECDSIDNHIELNKLEVGEEHLEMESDVEIIFSKQALNELCLKLQDVKEFAIVLLTEGQSYMNYAIVGISIYSIGLNSYIPLRHMYLNAPLQLNYEFVLEKVNFLFSSNKRKICHDIKTIKHILARSNLSFNEPFHDVMLEAHMLDASSKDDICSLARDVLGKEILSPEDILGKGVKSVSFPDIDICKSAEYAAHLCKSLYEIHKILIPKLENDYPMLQAYLGEELPLTKVLFNMEETGVFLDKNVLAEQSKKLKLNLDSVMNKLFLLAGEEFNASSPKQVGHVLYEKMGLPSLRKTPSGIPSTSEDTIAELAQTYEFPRLILEYRGLNKLINTYVDKLPLMVDSSTNRIHCCFNQNGTVTGRLSSSDPNLQNIPVRTNEGRAVRSAFAAPKGYKIVAADYSQIELRLMAHIADEKNMIAAFLDGKDIHASTAAQMHNLTIDQVTPELRRSAKAINFGLIYGMSAHGLAKQLGIERSVAQNYMEIYFAQYPGVKTFMNEIKNFVHKNGYVTTFSGRKLMFKNILIKNKLIQQSIERAAINAPMQGSAAEIIKRAMIKIYQWIETLPKDSIHLLMQVHDELVFEIKLEYVDAYKNTIAEIMSSVATLKVPLEVGIGEGSNWGEAH